MGRRILLLLVLAVLACPVSGSEAYFSPNGGILQQLLRRINHSQTSIDVAVYSLTSGDIAQSLADARARGVRIRVIRDSVQSGNRNDENAFLISKGVEVRVMSGRKPHGLMHHKFALFDRKILETGSFNWTVNGDRYSHENALFFDDPKLVGAFSEEFERLWKAASPWAARKHRAHRHARHRLR